MRMQRRWAQQLVSRFVRSIWILSAVLASLLTSQSFAQTGAQNVQQSNQQVALARALFEEGVALGDKGDWAGAADRFGRAYALKPTAGIAFNWASALSAVGKLTQASELLEGVSRDPKAAPDLKAESDKKLAEIAPRRPRLTVHVDASIAERATVQVDGNDWPRAVWDVSAPVDPGQHVAAAYDGERELARAELSLSEGESGELALGAPAVAKASAEDATTAVAHEKASNARSERKPLYKNWILWASVGAVVAGGVIVAVVATRDRSETEAPLVGNAGAGVIRW